MTAVVLVCYNYGDQIRRTLETLRSCTGNPRLYLIDNASKDNTPRVLSDFGDGAEVIYLDRNVGTAAAWNIGLAMALKRGVRYVMTMSQDVSLDPACLSRLGAVCETDSTIGAACPLLLYSDEPKKVQMYGGSVDLHRGLAWHDYAGVTESEELPPIRDAQYLDGGTMFLRAEVLRQTGLFDERLFMYCEDTDLSFRIRRAGYRTVAVRDARAWHYHRENKGALPPAHEVYYCTRNKFLLLQKHGEFGTAWKTALYSIWDMRGFARRFPQKGIWRLMLAQTRGIKDALTGRFGEQVRGLSNARRPRPQPTLL